MSTIAELQKQLEMEQAAHKKTKALLATVHSKIEELTQRKKRMAGNLAVESLQAKMERLGLESERKAEKAYRPIQTEKSIEALEPISACKPIEAYKPIQVPHPVLAVEAPEPTQAYKPIEAYKPTSCEEPALAKKPTLSKKAQEPKEASQSLGPPSCAALNKFLHERPTLVLNALAAMQAEFLKPSMDYTPKDDNSTYTSNLIAYVFKRVSIQESSRTEEPKPVFGLEPLQTLEPKQPTFAADYFAVLNVSKTETAYSPEPSPIAYQISKNKF